MDSVKQFDFRPKGTHKDGRRLCSLCKEAMEDIPPNKKYHEACKQDVLIKKGLRYVRTYHALPNLKLKQRWGVHNHFLSIGEYNKLLENKLEELS